MFMPHHQNAGQSSNINTAQTLELWQSPSTLNDSTKLNDSHDAFSRFEFWKCML
jgi:hypothetical protein